MNKIQIPNTDLTVSNICLGCGNFGSKLDKDTAFLVMDEYMEAGGSFLDTANVYCRWITGNANSSEEYIGEWLKSRRAYNKVVIGTKGAHYNFNTPEISRVTKSDIQKDLEESLETMGLEAIDLYWLHRDDKSKDIEEIMDWMEQLVREGKIRYYGASNFSLDRMKKAMDYAKSHNLKGFSAVSNQWSAASINHDNVKQDPTMECMDGDFYQWHKETNMPSVPYTSTAQGFFEKLYSLNLKVSKGNVLNEEVLENFDKRLFHVYYNQRNLNLYGDLLQIHENTGISLFALSVAYLLNQPFVTIPAGSVSKVSQLKEFIEASEVKVDAELIKKYKLL